MTRILPRGNASAGRRAVLNSLVVAFLLQASAGTNTIRVAGDVPCAGCSLKLDRVATIGNAAGSPQLLRTSVLARDSYGRYYVGRTLAGGQIGVYDRAGNFERIIGTLGATEGQFGHRINRLLFDNSGNLHVFEINRHSVLRPTSFAPESVRILEFIPGQVVISDSGSLIVQHRMMTKQGNNLVHVLGTDGRPSRSLVPLGSDTDQSSVGPRADFRVLGKATAAHVWVAEAQAYRLELWSLDGELIRSVVRETSLFIPYDDYDSREPLEKSPRPLLRSLRESADGLLWVTFDVAAADWHPAPREATERLAGSVNMSDYWDTIVEVLDLDQGTLVAQRRSGDRLRLLGGDGGGYYSVREEVAGSFVLDVWDAQVMH